MNHELKFGFGYRDTPVHSSSIWPGPAAGFWELNSVAASDCTAAGLPANCQIAAVTRDADKNYGEKYRDLYAGDTILMGNLTLQAGLRMDKQESLNTPLSVAASAIIGTPLTLPCAPSSGLPCTAAGNFTGSLAQLTFNGDSRKLSWNNVTPRLGLTYALGADKKTLLRAGYNRYVSQMGATVSNASPTGLVELLLLLRRRREPRQHHPAQRAAAVLRLELHRSAAAEFSDQQDARRLRFQGSEDR